MSAAASTGAPRVPLAALDADYRARRPAIDTAALRVLASGRYILGPEVEAFEEDLARYLGVSSVVSCGNGTDAIALMLAAAGAGPEDEVVVPANVCVPVLAGVRLSGARARLADVDEATLTLDAAAAEKAMTSRTRFLLPVHLYGGVADCDGLARLAERRSLTLLEDCAQSHGAALGGKKTGSFGRAASFSFYPTKNLGAFGDGGAVATSDVALSERVRRMRQYGWSRRDHADVEGRNSRLDELQAAILRVKLPSLDEGNARRRAIAVRYDEAFGRLPLRLLAGRPETLPARHLYVVRLDRRDDLRRHLAGRGVETGIHYPLPLHLQPAYAFLGHRPGDFPVSERAAQTILSLPMHSALTDGQVGEVIAAVQSFFEAAP
jgi:dTDP-3-amino-3,4,6-trideoxy-alpha-D-glucose transaminase